MEPNRYDYALRCAYDALEGAGTACPYHGREFDKLGTRNGVPNCESCRQPWRVCRALEAIEESGFVRWP